MNYALSAILTTRIVAIIRLERYDRAVEVARALVAGGITALEFTLTGAGAYDAIAAARAALGDAACVGVGSVLSPAATAESVAAGAQFVVTPVLRPPVIAACKEHGVPALCGALTPTEALAAHEAGADLVKIFPARAVGPQYIRDILAPLPMLRLVPTGAVAVGVGGTLVAASAVARGDWAQITAQAQACVAAVRA